MTEFYSNLPKKDKDSIAKTQEKLVDTDYKTKFEFSATYSPFYFEQSTHGF